MKVIDKVAWIYIQDKKILSTRSAGSEIWFLPGGKREPLENDVETLTREIKEELDVEIDLSSLRYIGTFQAQAANHAQGVIVKMTCYTADYKGQIRPTSEIAEYAFLSTADRDKISPVDQFIFTYLLENDWIE
ncbi:NUDIX hydrolase [Sphingobacterium wenxiniae]|uniref:NUDIX domain-containing protein n=1 Tax=Sphingobacterium wenxiniae TaxID=683125 RepID=A0A1I6SR66_9SPHI|nr:NUDIX domain-containing protein [Sphingobacterium wenxiniae]SFS79426.1 NUDIX domain-containing protein [Sphingobacterium wenxiniae]